MPSLSDLLADAIRRGLLNASLTKMHGKTLMWQASAKFTWSGGYHIAIEADPDSALRAVLAKAQAPEAKLPAVTSPFD